MLIEVENMKQWQRTLVSADLPMVQAISVLNESGLRILLVVDAECRLRGTVTDGDIRRALLNGYSLDVPLDQVMNPEPVSAPLNWSRSKFAKVMQEHQVLQLPIVSHDNKVVGLETLLTTSDFPKRDNAIFLMAGGFGTRLRPLTDECPKPLLKIGGKPILEIILEGFIAAGFHRFFISTHYMGDKIRDHFGDGTRWGVTIEYVEEKVPLGTAGSLSLLPEVALNSPVFVMNGDLLTQLNFNSLLDFHIEHQSMATMCVREHEFQIPYGVVKNNGQSIASIVEKPTEKFFINAGIYVLSPALIKTVPEKTKLDMPDLFLKAIGGGHSVNMFPLHEYWMDIGRLEDFKRAQHDFIAL
ncbi:MAG: nucleotidyltransferase family protein [Natronospirillum sp.]